MFQIHVKADVHVHLSDDHTAERLCRLEAAVDRLLVVVDRIAGAVIPGPATTLKITAGPITEQPDLRVAPRR